MNANRRVAIGWLDPRREDAAPSGTGLAGTAQGRVANSLTIPRHLVAPAVPLSLIDDPFQ